MGRPLLIFKRLGDSPLPPRAKGFWGESQGRAVAWNPATWACSSEARDAVIGTGTASPDPARRAEPGRMALPLSRLRLRWSDAVERCPGHSARGCQAMRAGLVPSTGGAALASPHLGTVRRMRPAAGACGRGLRALLADSAPCGLSAELGDCPRSPPGAFSSSLRSGPHTGLFFPVTLSSILDNHCSVRFSMGSVSPGHPTCLP